MKYLILTLGFGMLFIITSCIKPVTQLNYKNPDNRILFLHHSTGNNVWYGDIEQGRILSLKKRYCAVPRYMKEVNDKNNSKISIEKRVFPKGNPYPWQNDPYDYYNIWVKNGGEKPYMEEPTLEMLTKEYDIIIFKHCFPVSSIQEDNQNPDINSKIKTLANYKLQYNALKDKLLEFPKTKFIVWTGAALIQSQTNEQEAKRAMEFFEWVKSEWDQPNDNIFIFDFRNIETEGGLYLKPEYATSNSDSHPNKTLSEKSAELFVKRITEIIKE